MRVIKISNCKECPYFDSRGDIIRGVWVPVCHENKRVLPHEVIADGDRRLSVPCYEIPQDCPLDKEI